jgi:hypothetical protein
LHVLIQKEKTRMDAINLSIVLGPNILYAENHEVDPTFASSNKIVALLIEKYQKIFPPVWFDFLF